MLKLGSAARAGADIDSQHRDLLSTRLAVKG